MARSVRPDERERNVLADLDETVPTSFTWRLTLLATPTWNSAIGLSWVLVCFSALCVLAIGFVARFLPETKGLSVEEIVQEFERQAA